VCENDQVIEELNREPMTFEDSAKMLEKMQIIHPVKPPKNGLVNQWIGPFLLYYYDIIVSGQDLQSLVSQTRNLLYWNMDMLNNRTILDIYNM
jgi:hypothetical protein